jgi:delta-aminolevulinic acid dehydratase/porphobilinogen synthase
MFRFQRDMIYPLFIHDDDKMEEISSMPGCFRHSMTTMMKEIEEAVRYITREMYETEANENITISSLHLNFY